MAPVGHEPEGFDSELCESEHQAALHVGLALPRLGAPVEWTPCSEKCFWPLSFGVLSFKVLARFSFASAAQGLARLFLKRSSQHVCWP